MQNKWSRPTFTTFVISIVINEFFYYSSEQMEDIEQESTQANWQVQSQHNDVNKQI